MGFLTKFVLVLEVLYPAVASAAAASPAPRITSVQYSGNGCPNNAARSGDFNNPTFKFNGFTATSPGMNSTVNCAVHIQASGATAGWQVALSQATVQGHIALDPNAKVDLYTTTFFSQNADVVGKAQNTIGGDGAKSDRSISIKQVVPNKVYSSCIGSDGVVDILNINSRIALNGDGHGYFEITSENFDFAWRQC